MEKIFSTWVGSHIKFIFTNLMLGVLIYFTMMSENLVNSNDGIFYTSNYIAGNLEKSSGRGMLRYLDRIRSGVVSVPLNTILTLFIISIAGVLLLELFLINNTVIKILITLSLLANPVICATLPYAYTSVNYGLAFLSAIFAVYCIYYCSSHKLGVVCGGVCIAFSLGCYQAYFDVTCLVILLLLIKMIIDNEEWNKIVVFSIKSILSIIIGGMFYFIYTKILLMRAGIELSSYKGVSEVSLKRTFTNLLEAVPRCYRNFGDFFGTHKMFLTVPTMYRTLIISTVCISVFCIIYQFIIISRKNWKYALLFFLCVSLIPVASNAITLLVLISNSRLMEMGMIIYVVLMIVFIPTKGKISFVMKRVYCVFMILFLWTNILSVTNEQLALKEGKTASVGLARAIVSELIAEDYLEEDYVVAFIGRGPANDLFAKRDAWGKVWGENLFGVGWGNSDNRFWSKFLIEYCGISLNFCTQEQYAAVLENEDMIESMPVFPQNGSITEMDGVVVVKISDQY